jgi:membrane-associated phospholipid phosphatase
LRKGRALLAILSLLCGCIGSVLAENQQEEPCPKCFFPDLWEDQKKIWKTPFKKKTWQSPTPFIMLDSVGASFALDAEVSRSLRENESFEDFNKVFASRAADLILTAYPLSFIAAGHITDNKELAVYGWKATEAALGALIITIIFKKATLRARPHTGEPYDFWEGGNSFPSGHAAISWALAAYSAKHFSDKEWVRWIAYPIAGLVTLARVTSGHHFVSDAVTGSMIGFTIGRFVVK